MAPLVWLITGCSSGFGNQFVYNILARGDKVVATARDLSKIQQLKQLGVSTFQLDITDSQSSINATIAKVLAEHGRIDVLINNAAYIAIGTWEDLSYEDWLAQFDTNVFGTIKVTKAILPHFRERKTGTMVFISSLSGWIGHAGCSAYAGSKFALEGIVEGLHAETAHLGLKTLLIEPGRFRTKLLSSGNMIARTSDIPDYAEKSRAQMEGLVGEDQKQPGDPAKLVEIVLDLVREEGVAQGIEVPFRLPLGFDCYTDVKEKCEATLATLETWRNVATSTDMET
ncbi:NAD(P)-binding protein [Periconia macrospinosa]|uniref:NAD(P)-binding protein n=1 Tax=Periconia macrospinosa TaxID=97972 RepID=A0A2V1DWT1_9PLEO|nr:NAD(P)-binding protein [Periconia macrospinosa]